MALDPSISLAASAPTVDLGQTLTLASLAQRIRQQQQQQQGQNALRQIFANPQNLDQSGQLTPNALRQIMATDPATGLQLQESQLRLGDQRLKRADEIHGLIDPVRDTALNAYDEVIKAGGSQEAATAAGQRALSEGLEPLRAGGLLSDEEKGQLRSKFEYGPMKAAALSYKERLAQAEKEKADTRADTELGLNVKASARADEQLRLNENADKRAAAAAGREAVLFKEGQQGLNLKANPDALDEAARRYMATGAFPVGASQADRVAIAARAPVLRAAGVQALGTPAKEYGPPTPVTVKKPDGSSETIEAVYDKDNAKWLTSDGRKPIEGTVLPAKEAREEAGVISDKAANFIADRILAGDPNATKNMSRTKESMVKVENALTDKATALWGNGPRAAAEIMIATSGVRADQGSLQNLTKMSDAANAFEETASKNFDLALSRASTAVPTNWGPWVNKWVMDGETALGREDVPPYVAAMLTGANEYAKIMSGSTGSQGSTVDSRREAAELFSPYLSKGQIDEVVKVAKRDMANRKKSLHEQIDAIKDRMGSESAASPKRETSGAHLPDAARAKLRKGTTTTFANGQSWTLDDDGNPKQVK